MDIQKAPPNRPTKKLGTSDVINIDLLSDDAMINKRHIRASVVRVSNNTLWRWIRANRFPAPRITGGLNLWRVGDVRAWLRETAKEAA